MSIYSRSSIRRTEEGVFERIFLPIVEQIISINKEAKASEVPVFVGTENERKYSFFRSS
jgi:hypothetical protein